MKRSEAEKIINDWLDSSNVITGKTILNLLEGLGMQPPNITKMPDTWFRSTGDYGYEVAEWENEDEAI